MIYTIDLLDKARRELFESWEWYEEKEIGLGNRFEEAVYNKLDLITAEPLHYPIKKGKYHEAQIDDFSFVIVFKIKERQSLIVITSIFHTSRHPRRKIK